LESFPLTRFVALSQHSASYNERVNPRPPVDQRRETLVDIALSLLEEGGQEAVTMKAVGERSGLSRSAIYQYFASSAHILAELVVNEMADLVNSLEHLVDQVDDPLEKVRVWSHYSLAYLVTPEHALIQQISHRHLPDDQRGVIRALHGHLMALIVEPLENLGVKDAPSVCGLIYGSIAAAAERISEGSNFIAEAKLLEGFLEAGLRHYTASL